MSDYPWSSYKSYTENEDKLISFEDKRMIMDLFSGLTVHLFYRRIVELTGTTIGKLIV